MTPALLPFLLLAMLPFGLWLARGLSASRSRLARGGTAALAGTAAFTAVSHALVCAGVPGRIAAPLVGAAGLVAGVALLAAARARPAGVDDPPRRPLRSTLALEAVPLGLVLVLLAVPFRDALDVGITDVDAVSIWAPKAARALDEAPPVLGARDQAHPEYPRGIGIMTAAVAMPAGGIDPRLPRTVGLFLFALTLLCAFDLLSSRGSFWGAVSAVVISGSLGAPLYLAASGLMDGAMGAFILLASTGLAGSPDRRMHALPGSPDRRPLGLPLALAGGCAALATKDEGLAFFAAVLAVLAWRLVQSRELRRLGIAVGLAAIVAAPWLALRAQVRRDPPLLLAGAPGNAGLLLLRADAVLRELGHAALGLPDPSPESPPAAQVADPLLLAALACAIVLLFAARRGGFPVLPAVLLLLADAFVIVFSEVGIDWQMATACVRLVLQAFPVLLVAAVDRLTSPDDPALRAGEAATA